eukprot:7330494-Heterocapsa_arctica.AAC.1
MDGYRKDGDEWYYALSDNKHFGAKFFNRQYWYQNESKHSTNIENHLYEVANNYADFSLRDRTGVLTGKDIDDNHTLWSDTHAEQVHKLIDNKVYRNILAQIIRERGPDQAKTKPFGGTDGGELVNGKCKGAGRRT